MSFAQFVMVVLHGNRVVEMTKRSSVVVNFHVVTRYKSSHRHTEWNDDQRNGLLMK